MAAVGLEVREAAWAVLAEMVDAAEMEEGQEAVVVLQEVADRPGVAMAADLVVGMAAGSAAAGSVVAGLEAGSEAGSVVGSAVGSAVAVREASLVAVTAAEVAEKGLVVAEICLEATVDQGARMATDSTAAGSVVGWVAVAPQAERVVQTAG